VEIDMGELLRIAKKQKLEGRDALTDDEFYVLAGAGAVLGRHARRALGRTEQDRADTMAGFELFESLPREERAKYEDWTPQELQTLWPLIQEQDDERHPKG
jgi:hypothetical protein